ncbi:MAG: Gfo/Idh/MocA family oxidoreductase [Flavobacteriales bacterium]|nr:Gfo/Idh/MocA family oxidoreductase [Flavobacteriales bacterium]
MSIKFGIVGCGRIGNRHAEHIIAHSQSELVACYDDKLKVNQTFATDNNTVAADSLEELLANDSIDIINVCVPNGLHSEISVKALNAGKHVLVEKPMALTKAECISMLASSDANNKKLFVVKQNRFNPPVKKLKDLIDEGKLGEIYSVGVNCFWNRNEDYYKSSDWKGSQQLDGGTLFTQFSHFIDIAYYLFGDMENFSGVIKNCSHGDLIDFEDSGSIAFNFTSGAIGNLNYTTSCYQENMEGSIVVFAENGTIKIGGKYLNAIEFQKTNGFDIENITTSAPANNYGFYQGSMSNHDKLINNVIQALEGNQDILTTASEGMKVVEIIENMYKSVRRI